MAKHRVPRTGRPMLSFFGDLIARQQLQSTGADGRHEFDVRLYRTEAPGYVLEVRYRSDAADHYWGGHTPHRLKVVDLFDRYVREALPEPAAVDLVQEALHAVMLQAPELDEMIQWSSVVAGDT